MRHLAAVLAPLLLSGAAVADRCRALARLSTPTLEIGTARVGSMCRVTLIAQPRPAARIGIELWLPAARRWSGRYYQMGNGGFAGHIDGATLRAAAVRGDVAAATDTGHVGDGFDARWADGRPDLVEDYAYRSIKVTAVAARRLVAAYYRRPARRRYYMGCSYGGRQALVAAARWPADWDGVIAGAPAIRFLDRLVGFAHIRQALSADGGALSADRLPRLIAAARTRCRINSPIGCGASAVARGCEAGDRALCLTAPQQHALATIEAAGYPLADADAGEWRQWMLEPDPRTGSQLALADQGLRHLLGDNDPWSKADGAPMDVPAAIRALFAVGDLRPFEHRGGRVISYFGLADPVLPPSFAKADARAIGASDDAYRLLVVPGMAHCQGGPAAPRFGQSLPAPAMRRDAAHDIRRALERWVEEGRAPGGITVRTNNGADEMVPATRLSS